MCQFSDVNLLWCVEIDICNVQYFFFQKKKVQKCVRHNEYLKAISFGQWEGHKGCQSSLQWECGKQWLYNNVAVHEWFHCLCGHKWIVVMLPKKERGGGNNLFTMCLKILRTVLSMQFFFLFFISIGKTLGAEKKTRKSGLNQRSYSCLLCNCIQKESRQACPCIVLTRFKCSWYSFYFAPICPSVKVSTNAKHSANAPNIELQHCVIKEKKSAYHFFKMQFTFCMTWFYV